MRDQEDGTPPFPAVTGRETDVVFVTLSIDVGAAKNEGGEQTP